jgi:hypothetical protein
VWIAKERITLRCRNGVHLQSSKLVQGDAT